MFSHYSMAVFGPSQCGAYPGSHYSGVVWSEASAEITCPPATQALLGVAIAARWARVSPMARSNDDVSSFTTQHVSSCIRHDWFGASRSLGPSVIYGPQLRQRSPLRLPFGACSRPAWQLRARSGSWGSGHLQQQSGQWYRHPHRQWQLDIGSGGSAALALSLESHHWSLDISCFLRNSWAWPSTPGRTWLYTQAARRATRHGALDQL
jgi:hypothetical protein